MRTEDLIDCYPRLYHMAEADTWFSIQQYGLLSTTAILDLHLVQGNARVPYESRHRPAMMPVSANHALPSMMLRDQKPMPTQRLARALRNGITPQQWYELLNRKVFFWATEERLLTLLNARFYRTTPHDVLTVDTASLVARYEEQITLCHMNSGNTWPMPHYRDASIFKVINDYPAKPNGKPVKPVAELTVAYSVPSMAKHVIEVRRMVGSQPVETIYSR
jgi:hypothetical protein